MSSKKEKKESKNIKAEITPEEGDKTKRKEEEEQREKEVETVPQPEKKKKETQVDVLKERLKESEDKLLRVAADFDNFKKRTAREFENLVRFANESLITKLTHTLDNFERALDHAKNSTDFDNFHKGVELIYDSLKDVLEKEGLKPIKTVGETFDPNFHEAISQKESDEFPEGTIVNEISKGYILNGRVIKAPKVVVSTRAKKKEEQKEEEKVEAEEKESKEENKEKPQE